MVEPNAAPMPIAAFAPVLSSGDADGGSGVSGGGLDTEVEAGFVGTAGMLVALVDVVVGMLATFVDDDVEDFGCRVTEIAAELRVLKGSPTESRRNRPPPPSQQRELPSQQKSRGLEVTFSQGIRSLPPLSASVGFVRL